MKHVLEVMWLKKGSARQNATYEETNSRSCWIAAQDVFTVWIQPDVLTTLSNVTFRERHLTYFTSEK